MPKLLLLERQFKYLSIKMKRFLFVFPWFGGVLLFWVFFASNGLKY